MSQDDDDARRQLQALRDALDVPASQVSLETVVPVFVPDELASRTWPGPVIPVKVPGLAITWAALTAEQTMRYVTDEMAKLWSAKGRDWRAESMENLAALSEQLSSHSWVREDGSYSGLIMLHDDGIGPSRLLLSGWLEETFPEGYSCAIPERSVGVVVSEQASTAERQRVVDYVDHCYRNGTQPFIQGFFKPEQLVAREAA